MVCILVVVIGFIHNYDYYLRQTDITITSKERIIKEALEKFFELEDEQAITDITAVSVIKELQGGSYLIKKGDSGKSMFLMISGRLVAIVPDNYGKPMVVGDIGRGECVGCLLYTSPSPRDATLSRMPSSA